MRKLSDLIKKNLTVEDVALRAKSKIPKVAWEYLDCGTGNEIALQKNIDAFNHINLIPEFLKGELTINTSTTILSEKYNVPFGVAPIGLAGLMYPNAEKILAKTALKHNFPYCLSTVATQAIEDIHPINKSTWFQLYPAKEIDVSLSILKELEKHQIKNLVITVDVPKAAKRERSAKAGLQIPPKFSLDFIWQAIQNPNWTIETLKNGLPRLKTIEKYAHTKSMSKTSTYVGNNFGGTFSWEYLSEIRKNWKGNIILKGIQHKNDARKAIDAKVDALYVSNHGARQFNGSRASLDSLIEIKTEFKNEIPLFFDSGIRSGLDILKAIYCGADFVFLGRPFMYGVSAFGKQGGEIIFNILKTDLENNMHQFGCKTINEIKTKSNLWKN